MGVAKAVETYMGKKNFRRTLKFKKSGEDWLFYPEGRENDLFIFSLRIENNFELNLTKLLKALEDEENCTIQVLRSFKRLTYLSNPLATNERSRKAFIKHKRKAESLFKAPKELLDRYGYNCYTELLYERAKAETFVCSVSNQAQNYTSVIVLVTLEDFYISVANLI